MFDKQELPKKMIKNFSSLDPKANSPEEAHLHQKSSTFNILAERKTLPAAGSFD